MHRLVIAVLLVESVAISAGAPKRKAPAKPAPAYYPDEPGCKVKAVQKLQEAYENVAVSTRSDTMAVTQPDSKGVYQVYIGKPGGTPSACITCTAGPGRPRQDRNKPFVMWHPSGQWLMVGAEEDNHDNMWMPQSWKRGLLQSGIWLNIWFTTPTGDRWYQITDFKKSKENPSNGFVGIAFTPDGRRGAWAEIVDGNIFANHFGIWKLFLADFQVIDGAPSLVNKRDITPEGARWVEPGNFAADNRHLLLSADVGLKDAQGQDQFALDIVSGQLQRLTDTPDVWDEHGVYSADGSKISFMSSYPFRADPDNFKVKNLKTEFMLMDADGSHLQQITHFNEPGFPESQKDKTIAAVAVFSPDGSELLATVMAEAFTKTNWKITFEGRCGVQRGTASSSRTRSQRE